MELFSEGGTSFYTTINSENDYRTETYTRKRLSNPYPLNLIERHRIVDPVVHLRCLRRGVSRHLLRFFQRSAVAHVLRDPRCPKCVRADVRGDSGSDGMPFDHSECVIAVHDVHGQIAAETDGTEQGSGWLPVQLGRGHIQQILLGVAMERPIVVPEPFSCRSTKSGDATFVVAELFDAREEILFEFLSQLVLSQNYSL